MNSILKKKKIILNTKTTEEWDASEKVLKFNMPYYSRDIIDGVVVHRAKVGDGVNKWSDLPYWINPSVSMNKPPILTVSYSDLTLVGDEQVYENMALAGLTYRIFWQNTNRFYYDSEIIRNEAGGFTLTPSARIYEGQEIIVIF